MWIQAGSSNNDPRYITHYYIRCVKEVGGMTCWSCAWFFSYTSLLSLNCDVIGCPQVLRTDLDTENSYLAVIQPILRHYHDDEFAGNKSHVYGKSTANQVL